MKLTQEKLNEILASHEKWLQGEKDGKRANLCNTDLRGADLRGASFNCADLYRADFCGADLRDANFRGANLREANLYGADLCNTNLCNTKLCGADLRKTYYQVVRIGSRNAQYMAAIEFFRKITALAKEEQ